MYVLLLYGMCVMCMEQSSYGVYEGIIASLFHPCTDEPMMCDHISDFLSQRVYG